MRHWFAVGFTLVAALFVAPRAIGSTLAAGQILEIRFTTTAPVCPGPCDVLELYPNETGSFFASSGTANLFDSNVHLGTYFTTFCCVPFFRSPSSLFQAGSATVDFTAINSGSINGILDMSIGTGFFTWPSAPTPTLLIGHGEGPGGVLGGSGIQVNSVSILSSVPERSTFATLLVGLALLAFWQSRAQRL